MNGKRASSLATRPAPEFRAELNRSVEQQIALELFQLVEKHCADSGMLQDVRAVLNNWGYTQSADDVLNYLKEVNHTGRVFHAAFDSRNKKGGRETPHR